MSIVVPFDGSVLAKTALLHAENAAKMYGESVIAVTVIPRKNDKYAREERWLSPDEEYDKETIVARLRRQVKEITPDSEFEHIPVSRYSSSGTISSRIRRFAREKDASAVFIGSGNAGRMVIGAESVGGRIAADLDYDIAIFRHALSEAKQSS